MHALQTTIHFFMYREAISSIMRSICSQVILIILCLGVYDVSPTSIQDRIADKISLVGFYQVIYKEILGQN